MVAFHSRLERILWLPQEEKSGTGKVSSIEGPAGRIHIWKTAVMHKNTSLPSEELFDNCLTNGYPEDMASKRIKTRELLRNFKALKAQLVNGQLESLIIDVGDQELELSMRKPTNTVENLLNFLRANPKPVRIRRTDIFEELFQPRPR